ncbi:hypothetical protein LY78DRAFT_657023 [Colletotrichum sublineola]|uniref:Uncharacterized protein n=1 Tax=Colletotrichum sublineola TaxID=1173701 RepID=A0A066XS90_COLSU|nr:hypothetical protein LY78DRAFT_657023 [Colletotrichum sublineola]KDN68850.1 hypothetical protein CSUB01_05235 [Colletotrichum sublineola]
MVQNQTRAPALPQPPQRTGIWPLASLSCISEINLCAAPLRTRATLARPRLNPASRPCRRFFGFEGPLCTSAAETPTLCSVVSASHEWCHWLSKHRRYQPDTCCTDCAICNMTSVDGLASGPSMLHLVAPQHAGGQQGRRKMGAKLSKGPRSTRRMQAQRNGVYLKADVEFEAEPAPAECLDVQQLRRFFLRPHHWRTGQPPWDNYDDD